MYHQFFPVVDLTTLSRRSEISTTTIFNPGYPDPYAFGTPLFVAQSTLPAQAASDLQNPYLIYGGVSIEKYFASDLVVSASYDIVKGLHQIRRRNINAPIPGTVPPGTPQNVVNQMRPFFPITSTITQFESAGSFRTHGLSLRLRTGRLHLPAVSLQMTSGYTLGSSEDDNSVPANAYDLRAEWARSSFFPRHHLWSGVNAQAPLGNLWRDPRERTQCVALHGHYGYRHERGREPCGPSGRDSSQFRNGFALRQLRCAYLESYRITF